MTGATIAMPATPDQWVLPSKGRVGMLCLIAAESAIFVIFIVAYLYYAGQSLSGPLPGDVLELPIFISICLLASSPTISAAVRALEHGRMGAFRLWWLATIVLAVIFLAGTAHEWYLLIYEHGLTIRTNLFGTTFYSLVGLHGTHVILGLVALTLVMVLAWRGSVRREHAERTDVLAMYWHFVDVVWIIVFAVVYIIGR
jgi:cytochrome c oxidase subunit III